ncbi:hypothetical protein BRD20_05605 [Halobacteriales archaeon SW_8_65_20]|nr:MAG: hypothetical protein BRD20_05605 [Halobacteriales archaeon SW_8_65_20]
MDSGRTTVLLLVVVLSTSLLAGVAYSSDTARQTTTDERYTLFGVQADGWFGNDNGYAAVVDESGTTVWNWSVPNSRVFDTEQLENGNILVSVAVSVPQADCPTDYREDRFDRPCVRNRVVELDYETQDIVWEYDWYDAFPNHHEVHDADRLPSGETAIADMGNHRAFAVDQSGTVTWEWNASDHISRDTEWFDEHVPEGSEDEFASNGPESDWTHLNDIDRLDDGNFLLSIRNYDVVLEVARNESIVETYGEPGDHSIMDEQHNPNLLAETGTLVVADSGNDRIVELDAANQTVISEYGSVPAGSNVGDPSLRWPRDADRLPNGNTLITDSRRFRILEVAPNGSVVWSHLRQDDRSIVYEADRIRLDDEYLPEEPSVSTDNATLVTRTNGPLVDLYATLDSYLAFVPFLPLWVGPLPLVIGLVDLGALLLLVRGRLR